MHSLQAELWLESVMEVVIQVDPWASEAIGSTDEQVETTDGFWSIGADFWLVGASSFLGFSCCCHSCDLHLKIV